MLQVVARLVGLTANMIPLVGILYWQWDTFQLLNLYWVETVILAFWTLMRLSQLPPEACGTLTMNGKVEQATPPVPERAVESVQDDVDHVKERASRS